MGGDGGFPQVVATIFKLDTSELADLGCAGSVTWWHKCTPTQICLFWFFILMRFECQIQINTPFLPQPTTAHVIGQSTFSFPWLFNFIMYPSSVGI